MKKIKTIKASEDNSEEILEIIKSCKSIRTIFMGDKVNAEIAIPPEMLDIARAGALQNMALAGELGEMAKDRLSGKGKKKVKIDREEALAKFFLSSRSGHMKIHQNERVAQAILAVLQALPDDVLEFASTSIDFVISNPAQGGHAFPCKGPYGIHLNPISHQLKDAVIWFIVAHEIAHNWLDHAGFLLSLGRNKNMADMEKEANSLCKKWGFPRPPNEDWRVMEPYPRPIIPGGGEVCMPGPDRPSRKAN